MHDITGVITSCRRPDLLDRTLTSLLQHAPELAARLIVIEDSDGAAVTPLMGRFPSAIRYICNGSQIGQHASIDRAYGLVETGYIFHCEDDWLFYRGGFLAESMRLLEALPRASMVSVRRAGSHPGRDRMVLAQPISVHDGMAFRWLAPEDRPERGGYAFNPGLRLLADWKTFGPFARHAHELEISTAFHRAGRCVLQLEHSACEHIGWERHVEDPRNRRPLRKRLQKSLRKAIRRLAG